MAAGAVGAAAGAVVAGAAPTAPALRDDDATDGPARAEAPRVEPVVEDVAEEPHDSAVEDTAVGSAADETAVDDEGPGGDEGPMDDEAAAGSGRGMWKSTPRHDEEEETPDASSAVPEDLSASADDLEWVDPRAGAGQPETPREAGDDPGFGRGADELPEAAGRHSRDEPEPQAPEPAVEPAEPVVESAVEPVVEPAAAFGDDEPEPVVATARHAVAEPAPPVDAPGSTPEQAVWTAPDPETTGPIPVVPAEPDDAAARNEPADTGGTAPTRPVEPPAERAVVEPGVVITSAPPSSPQTVPPVVPAGGAHRHATSDGRLIGRVREVLAVAAECYRATPHTARLAALAARLDEPLRIGFAGPPGIGTSTLVEAVLGRPGGPVPPPPTRLPVWWRHGDPVALAVDTSGRTAPYAGPWPPDPTAPLDRIELHVADALLAEATIVDTPGLGTDGRAEALLDPGDPVPDALVLLLTPAPGSAAGFGMLHSGVVAHSRANALGVLARADELPGGLDPAIAQRAAAELAGRSDVRRLCRTVLPVSGSLARAATGLTPPEIDALARGAAVDPGLAARLGPAGLGAAAALARTAPDPGAVVAGLLARSGVGRLRELIAARFVGRSEILVARSVLQRLELLVRTDPPADARRLQYELERVRTGAHELAETDLLDELLAGTVVLPPAEVAAAEQLLGMAGQSPAARLGLPPDAAPDAVRSAAAERLAYWQRAGSHPASSQAVRSVAAVLVRTCEQLVATA